MQIRRLKAGWIAILLPVWILAARPSLVRGQDPAEAPVESEAPADAAPANSADERGPVSLGHKILLYLPNRLFDLADVLRLRARVGPGVALGVRATDYVDLYLGSHASVFAGLPGPRMERKVPIPVGLETLSGVEVSKAEALTAGRFGPDYSPTEFGANVQLILIGADLELDPVEVVDFFTGLVTWDLRKDDL